MDVLFYHLERVRLEQVLPNLLERSLERGWKAVVKSGGTERLEALDQYLWTYKREAFLPHGTSKDGFEAMQPVYLTTGDDNPNGAEVLFLVDGAGLAAELDYERLVYLFDGADEDMLEIARADWKMLGAAGYETTYWQQDDLGKWVKKNDRK